VSTPFDDFDENEVESGVRKRKTSSKASKRSSASSRNGHAKLRPNGIHKNGVHGNSTPIPYVPVEPRPNSEAPPSSNIKASSTGECSSCGRKNVLVSMPPMRRCIDHSTCEEVRKLIGLMRSGKPIPVTKRAVVVTKRHGVPYYLKTVYYKTRELQAGEIVNAPTANRIVEKTIGEALELVREKSEATKFPPDKANHLAAIWGAVAREV
jgi:hypothetical protein